MIIEIEYHKGDTLLSGTVKHLSELKKQLQTIEAFYDRENDNFTELLCRMYQWMILNTYENPDYTYDRDTQRLYQNHIDS